MGPRDSTVPPKPPAVRRHTPRIAAEGLRLTFCGCAVFQVETDPWEREDVAAANPSVVSKMQARLAALVPGVFEGVSPIKNSSTVCEATAKNGGCKLLPSFFLRGHALVVNNLGLGVLQI